MDEERSLREDEYAILEWLFEKWPDLSPLRAAMPPEAVADIFYAEDGYSTFSFAVPVPDEVRLLPSPYPGEVEAMVDGMWFGALLFLDSEGVMLEAMWSPESPGRLPTKDELTPIWRERTS